MAIAKPQYQSLYTINLGKYNFSIRPEEKSGLDKRLLENPELKKSVLKKRVNDELHASLEYAVVHKSNSVIQTFGIPESGKSTILKIIVYHLYRLLESNDKKPKISLTYNYMETIHEIYNFAKSHKTEDGFEESDDILIIFQDEQTTLQGNESKSYEVQLNNLLENFRAAQIFVFLASPNLKRIAVCNTYIEAIAKDMGNRINWGLWMVPKRNGNKTVFAVHGSLLLEYTKEIEDFFSSYNQRKMDHIFTLMENRGLQTVQIPDEVLAEAIDIVIKEAEKRGLRTKEQIKALTNVLGVGTSNTTKAVAELAGLQFEAIMITRKEQEAVEMERQLFEEKKEEEKRISKLVLEVAKELYERFDFDELKKASRIVTGWIIEHYPLDWQELIKHKKYYWSLAEYWQYSTLGKNDDEKNSIDLVHIESDRELLRKALEEAIFLRYKDEDLSKRIALKEIYPDDVPDKNSWSQSKQAKILGIASSTLNAYFKRHKKKIYEILNNRKIWGDAGELYLKYKILKFWQKGQNEFLIDPDHTIELSCAADDRVADNSKSRVDKKSDKSTSLYDLEVWINGRSVAAINCKFTYLEGQSFKMSPESEHDHPYLFVIDKATLRETLILSEKGKPRIYINGESSIVSLEEIWENLDTSKK